MRWYVHVILIVIYLIYLCCWLCHVVRKFTCWTCCVGSKFNVIIRSVCPRLWLDHRPIAVRVEMAHPNINALWEFAFDWEYTEGQLGFDNLASVTWHVCTPSQNERFNTVWDMVVHQHLDAPYCVIIQQQNYSSTKYIYTDYADRMYQVYLVFMSRRLARSSCCYKYGYGYYCMTHMTVCMVIDVMWHNVWGLIWLTFLHLCQFHHNGSSGVIMFFHVFMQCDVV